MTTRTNSSRIASTTPLSPSRLVSHRQLGSHHTPPHRLLGSSHPSALPTSQFLSRHPSSTDQLISCRIDFPYLARSCFITSDPTYLLHFAPTRRLADRVSSTSLARQAAPSHFRPISDYPCLLRSPPLDCPTSTDRFLSFRPASTGHHPPHTSSTLHSAPPLSPTPLARQAAPPPLLPRRLAPSRLPRPLRPLSTSYVAPFPIAPRPNRPSQSIPYRLFNPSPAYPLRLLLPSRPAPCRLPKSTHPVSTARLPPCLLKTDPTYLIAPFRPESAHIDSAPHITPPHSAS